MLNEKHAIVIIDLGYGDAGKGSTVDYLARETNTHTVIRYNGAAQAAHNVITPDGRHHTFAQFGSGTFVPKVRTHLSEYMLIRPTAMMNEEQHLRQLGIHDAFRRTTIDEEAALITDFHVAVNQLKEMHRSKSKHGSCGMGVGETMADNIRYPNLTLRVKDLLYITTLRKKLKALRELQYEKIRPILGDLPQTDEVKDTLAVFDDPKAIDFLIDEYLYFSMLATITKRDYVSKILSRGGTVIFESAQGLLLDEWHGFYPHNSWSDLTTKNACEMLSHFSGRITKIGLTRAYSTRHGAGPFVTEDDDLANHIPDTHNGNGKWQGKFRVGPVDLLTLKYALNCVDKIDGLVVTNLDRLTQGSLKLCTSYEYVGKSDKSLDPFFTHSKNRITEINVLTPKGISSDPNETELQHLRKRTKILMECKPNYEIPKMENPLEFAELICNKLNVPLAISSFGATANDKLSHINIH